MERLKIAAVQMNAMKEDLDHNIEVHRSIAREAAEAGCRLVMFPELSVTAHFGDAGATSLAQPATSGSIYETMLELARELSIVISYGFCERAQGTFYNSQALVGPDGLIGVQRKTHASVDEYFYFRMGRSLEVFDLGFCKVGTLICYDCRFFEAWRVLTLKEADVILLPHAARSGWGKRVPEAVQVQQLKDKQKKLPDRNGVLAEDNAVFAVLGNQVDYNGHSTHSGGAYILSPRGEVLSKSKPALDDLWISADLDPALLHECRNARGATLKMRRPELYGEVVGMV